MRTDNHIVSVIIPTKGRTTINLSKDALEKQSRHPDEVIVIMDHEKRGSSWARNEGIRQASGDLIAFTDDDCVPPEDWLERLIEAIDKYDAAGAGGTYLETDPLLIDVHSQRNIGKMPLKEIQTDTTGLVGNTGNVMYKSCWLDSCAEHDGYIFNESFKISQDWELAWRLRRYGAKLIYVPIKVTHLRKVTPISYLLYQFKRGIGISGLYRIQSSVKSEIVVHKSHIWGQTNAKHTYISQWIRAFWYKMIGPFNIMNFERKRNFLIFWIGEKFQGMGFIWGLVHH